MSEANLGTWRSIGEIVNEIVRLQTELRKSGIPADDPCDREAFDTLARIERRILKTGINHDPE